MDYTVILGIDKAGKDTGRRLTMRVCEQHDPLSAAITAERMADRDLEDPSTMYTHAMRVQPVSRPIPIATAIPRMRAWAIAA